MTTYQLLKQLNNKRGGIHSDLCKKPEALAPVPVEPAPQLRASSFFSRFLVSIVAVAFLGCFWMIFQLVNTTQVHEVRFQRLISALDKQEVVLKSIDQKIATVSAELPKINEDIVALSKKTDAAVVEAEKLNEIVAGQVETIETLKKETISLAAQTKVSVQ